MADAQTTLDLSRRFSRAVRTVKMYGAEHPQFRSDVDAFRKILDKHLSSEPKLNFILQGNAVLVQEIVQPFKDQAVIFLVESMRSHGVTSLSFFPGVSQEEIEHGMKLLAAKPQDVMDGAVLKADALKGLDRLRLNDIKFVAVSETEAVVDASQAVIMPSESRNLEPALAEMAKSSDTRRRLFGDSTAPRVGAPPTIDELLPKLQQLTSQGQMSEAKRSVIDFITNSLVPGTRPLGDQLQTALDRMPASLRDQYQGPAIRADVSAAFMARQLQAPAPDPAALEKTFRELAPDVGDALVLLDAVARALRATSHGASIETLERAMKFLPQLDAAQALITGNVLIADGHAERRASYKKALSEAGYIVDVVGTAKETADQAIAKGNYDCIVMDMNLPDKSGGTVLSRLLRAKMLVPVVIATPKATTYQFDFEIFSYPKKKFIAVLEPEAVVAAVKEMATKREKEVDVAEEAEKKRAKEVQEKLIPKEPPVIPGWDVSWVYQPAGQVGGDYLDIFTIDADRIGFVVGDVSGKGTSAAMVMVMVRSAFRLATPGISSAREAVMRVNRLVTPDMKKGMFVTLVFASLNTKTGKLTLVNCAHNPPFVRDGQTGEVKMMGASGLAMGMAGPAKFEGSLVEETLELTPGSHLVFYTDGVVEAMNQRNEEWSEESAMEKVKAEADNGTKAVVEGMNAGITKHRGPAAQSDDITILDLARAPAAETVPGEGTDVEAAPRTLLDE